MGYEFSSTQIEVPAESKNYFINIGKNIVKPSQIFNDNGYKGYEDDPHITILYGIHSSQPSIQLINTIKSYPKFVVRLTDISLFKGAENNNPFDVVKVNVDCEDLYVLNQTFRDICEYTNRYDEYIPHLTVAYVKPDTCDYLNGLKIFDGLTMLIDSVVFSSKEGVKRSIPLGQI